MNLSNLSPETLHIGHISGGFSLAHRYPQTLQRHTGSDSSVEILALTSFHFLPSLQVMVFSQVWTAVFSHPSISHPKHKVRSNMHRNPLDQDPCNRTGRSCPDHHPCLLMPACKDMPHSRNVFYLLVCSLKVPW